VVVRVCFTQACLTWHETLIGFLNLLASLPLIPLGFISPRNAPGISPSELSPSRDWSLLSKCPTLLPLAASRTLSAIFAWVRSSTANLQFGFRVLYPLEARSHRGWWLASSMADALLVFHSSSGVSYSLSCALPTKIFVGVVPLLRRRLS